MLLFLLVRASVLPEGIKENPKVYGWISKES